MNLLQRLGNLFAEKRSLGDPGAPYMYQLLGGASSYAGPSVNEDNAMRSSAVYACIRIISESIASLPLVLYKQTGRNKERATKHPLYPVLHDLANQEMTALEWRELMISHVLLRGNGYSEIETDSAGRVVGLEPLRPDRMEEVRRNGSKRLEYMYRQGDGTLRMIPGFRIHHIKGLGDGLVGYSPIGWAARQAIGLSLAAEEYGARFYSNGARPGLILRHPGKLSAAAHERLRVSFATEHQGVSNAHKTKILEEGMDVTTIGIPNNEAQFLETRKFQVTEIARIYRVPPHMLADLDRATFSNIEQQSINFVVYTLMPWLVRHEQAIYRDLLDANDRKAFFAKYIVEGMLRGDTLSRYQSYQVAINNTILTPNEIRELEDRNPIDGGDKLFVPLNMIELGAPPPPVAAPAPAPAKARALEDASLETRDAKMGNDRRAMMNRHVRLFEDAASRAVMRETSAIRKAAKARLGTRSAESFQSWLETFYKQLRTWFPGYFSSLMESYAETVMASVADELGGEPAPLDEEMRTWIAGYLANFTEVYAVGGEKQLRTLIAESKDDAQAATAINDRMDGWDATKATKTGLDQAFEAGNALALFGYSAASVSFLVWRTSGKSCPLCQKMNGRRIKVGGYFVKEGDTVHADGVDPLPVIRNMRHAPLHSGCLTGDSLVSSRHRISAVSKRWFDGEIVVIQTANGHKLSCTPNHPILTRGGWVAAGILNIGDNVICDLSREGRGFADGDDQDVPTRIEEVVDAFGRSPEVISRPVPVSAEHFHGDGGNSQVAVIWANRLLMDGLDSSVEQHSAECPLITGNSGSVLLAGFSRETLFREGLFTASSGNMGGGDLGLTFAVSHLSSAYQPGGAVAAGSYAILEKDAPDNIRSNATFERQGVFGLPAEIGGDEIVSVSKMEFSGHVYNLQTETGWYMADSIITHNCDCVVLAG